MSFFSSVRGNLGSTGRGVRRRQGPTWVTAAGSLGTTFDSQRTSKSYSVSAIATGETITYAVTSGSLPTGMSLTTANGFIGGTASAVGSNTTSTFDITATASGGLTAVRSFSIEVKAPQITSFTATGSTTFSVPTGISTVQVLVVAGGGGSGRYAAGGGGGFIEHPSLPVTPGGSIPVTVGAGGTAGNEPGNVGGGLGGNSVFGPLTALGGGGGKWHGSQGGPAELQPTGSGGSGAGGDSNPPSGTNLQAGTGLQPTQPGDSGTFGYGNPGGAGGNAVPPGGNLFYVGGGGGGAGEAGFTIITTGDGAAGNGGAGRASSISGSSVTYAGGGGGSYFSPVNNNGGAGGVGGGGRGNLNLSLGLGGTEAGGTNLGGGAGGGGAAGGPGIVIVRF